MWVSLVLAWRILTEVIKYISQCQERILNTVNWENGILPFSQLQKTQLKSIAAILSYEAKVWILVLSESMIKLLCQTGAMIMTPWEYMYLQFRIICVHFLIQFEFNEWFQSNEKIIKKLISPSSGEEQLALHGSLQSDSASLENTEK